MKNKYYINEPFEMAGVSTIGCDGAVIGLRKAVELLNKLDKPVKIIQLLPMPNDATYQGAMLGLGSDGVVYENKGDCWFVVLDNKFK